MANTSSTPSEMRQQAVTISPIPLDSIQTLVASFLLAALTPCFPKSSPLRSAVFLLHLTFLVNGFFAPAPAHVPNPQFLYTNGLLHANLLFRYFDRLWILTPEDAFYRKRADGSKEDPKQLGGWRKFLWTFELLATTRGIGWNWEINNLPKPSRKSRAGFVWGQLRSWVLTYAGLYAVSSISKAITYGLPSISNATLRQAADFAADSQALLVLYCITSWTIIVYSHFAIWILPLSMICVGLEVGPKAWQTQDAWPRNFGHIADSYSIRRFWGMTWHQQLRRITSRPGALALSKLPMSFQKGKGMLTRLSRRYGLVFIAFFVSGLIHASGTYTTTRIMEMPLSDGNEMKYFMLQACALVVEDFICFLIGVDDQNGKPPTTLRRLLGYVFTGAWYAYSRVGLKGFGCAKAQGYWNDRGMMYAVVHHIGHSADVVPGNFVKVAGEWLRA